MKDIEKEKIVAEKLNGRLAMLGIVAGIGAYLTTGQLILWHPLDRDTIVLLERE